MALSRERHPPLNYVDIKTRMINYLAIYEFPRSVHRYARARVAVYSYYYSWTR